MSSPTSSSRPHRSTVLSELVRERWEADFLARERLAVLVITGCVIVLSEAVLGPERLNAYLDEHRFAVFPQLAALFGALLGLVLAASALVIDRIAEGRLDLVLRSEHAPKLWDTFGSAMASLGAATLISIVVLIPTSSAVVDRIIVYLWTLASLLVVARLARTIWIVGLLMNVVGKQGPRYRRPNDSG